MIMHLLKRMPFFSFTQSRPLVALLSAWLFGSITNGQRSATPWDAVLDDQAAGHPGVIFVQRSVPFHPDDQLVAQVTPGMALRDQYNPYKCIHSSE